jgi:hypothetical protein
MTLNDARLIVLLLGLATLVLVIGNLDYSRWPAPVVQPPPATQTPAAKTSREPTRAPATPQRGEVVLEITEAELSNRISQRFVGRQVGGSTIERTQASLRAGKLEVSGTARVAGAGVPFTSSLSPTPDSSGRVRLAMDDARVGGIPLPQAARAELQGELQRELDGLLSRQPMRVRSIEITDGVLRAVGTPGG